MSKHILSKETILQKCKVEQLEEVQNLNLWGKEIEDLSILKELPNVEIVSLSLNKISTLKDFQYCRKLAELYLRKNQITDFEEINHLKQCRNLKTLWLEENKICETENYRLLIVKALPQLIKLDNVNISSEEREKAANLTLNVNVENNVKKNSPRVIFKEIEDSPTTRSKKLLFEENTKYKLNQIVQKGAVNVNTDKNYPQMDSNNNYPSKIPTQISTNSNSKQSFYKGAEENKFAQRKHPSEDKEIINFNMQKISNLKGNNGFFSHPNKTDYPTIHNDAQLKQPYYNHNNINYNYNNSKQINNNSNYNMYNNNQHHYNNNNNLPSIVYNHQNFPSPHNQYNLPPQHTNSNILLAVKHLLAELNQGDLATFKSEIERKLRNPNI